MNLSPEEQVISKRTYAPSIKIDAVWYDEATDNVFRIPIIAILEVITEDRYEEKFVNLYFLEAEDNGYIESLIEDLPPRSRDFLGYEFNGEQRSHIEKITKIKK